MVLADILNKVVVQIGASDDAVCWKLGFDVCCYLSPGVVSGEMLRAESRVILKSGLAAELVGISK